jgi:hypothetical protein
MRCQAGRPEYRPRPDTRYEDWRRRFASRRSARVRIPSSRFTPLISYLPHVRRLHGVQLRPSGRTPYQPTRGMRSRDAPRSDLSRSDARSTDSNACAPGPIAGLSCLTDVAGVSGRGANALRSRQQKLRAGPQWKAQPSFARHSCRMQTRLVHGANCVGVGHVEPDLENAVAVATATPAYPGMQTERHSGSAKRGKPV